jgi:hypothetical protein
MFYALDDGYLHLKGEYSFILVAKVRSPFGLCIETADGEFVQGIHIEDLIAVSAPEGGPIEPAVMLIEMVRAYHMPLVVLPKGHPGSKRLRWVVSAGERIEMNCGIQRGTHPEQHLLCSSGEFAGTLLTGVSGGVHVDNPPSGILAEYLCRITKITG